MNDIIRAFELWQELTGVDPSTTTYNYNNWGVVSINDELKESVELDKTYLTTMMLLDYFATKYLDQRSFAVNQILNNYDVFLEYLKKSKELYSILQSEEITEIRSAFQESILEALKHYEIDRPDVIEMVQKPHILAFIRRDALKSIEKLAVYQFLQGESDNNEPKYIKNVFEFWNINSLVDAMCNMGYSGISLNLIRDPESMKSYFAFGIRNGGTVSILTDKPNYVHPMEHELSRRPDRDFAERISQHHFPYKLLNPKFHINGRIYFDKDSKELVLHQKESYPIKPINELAPNEIIWVLMMFHLIKEKFWNQNFKTPSLSYTGEMIVIKDTLVEKANQLAVNNYKTIEAEALTKEDVSTDNMIDEWSEQPTEVHRWLEERYEDKVDDSLLNIVGNKLALTSGQEDDSSFMTLFEKPKIELQAIDPKTFGTQEQLIKEQRWVARYNKAIIINEEAKKEYADRKKEVREWYRQALLNNSDNILKLIAEGSCIASDIQYEKDDSFKYLKEWTPKNILTMQDLSSDENYGRAYAFSFHQGKGMGGQKCFVNGAKPSFRAIFRPQTAGALALLCGCEINQLPDVLHHWVNKRQMTGNQMLRNIDPMEWVVENPWRGENFDLIVYLSRTGYSKIRKDNDLPPNKFWEQ